MSARVAYDWFDVLRLAGYAGCVGDEIPDWVEAVWIGYSLSSSNGIFDAVKAAGEEFREQLEAASRLGGHNAVWALVDDLLAQGVQHADR